MEIPTQLTEQQFQQYIEPHLSKAKRGYVSEYPLYKVFNYILYKLATGCQWGALPIEMTMDGQRGMSYQVPYYIFARGVQMEVFSVWLMLEFWPWSTNWICLNSIWMAATRLLKKGRKCCLSRQKESKNQQHPATNRQEWIYYCNNKHSCWQP